MPLAVKFPLDEAFPVELPLLDELEPAVLLELVEELFELPVEDPVLLDPPVVLLLVGAGAGQVTTVIASY